MTRDRPWTKARLLILTKSLGERVTAIVRNFTPELLIARDPHL